MKPSRPLITLLMAMTLDGKIAKHAHHLVDWTSEEDKQFFSSQTKNAGAVIMGKNTYDTIGRPLPGRLTVVLTSRAKEEKSLPGLLEFQNTSPERLLEELIQRGYTKVILAGGAALNGEFLKARLIDEIVVTIEPRLFGKGLDLFSDIDCDIPLTLISMNRLNPDVIALHYKVNNNLSIERKTQKAKQQRKTQNLRLNYFKP